MIFIFHQFNLHRIVHTSTIIASTLEKLEKVLKWKSFSVSIFALKCFFDFLSPSASPTSSHPASLTADDDDDYFSMSSFLVYSRSRFIFCAAFVCRLREVQCFILSWNTFRSFFFLSELVVTKADLSWVFLSLGLDKAKVHAAALQRCNGFVFVKSWGVFNSILKFVFGSHDVIPPITSLERLTHVEQGSREFF